MEFLPEGKALGSTSGSTFLLAHANLDVIVTKANKQLFINLSNNVPWWRVSEEQETVGQSTKFGKIMFDFSFFIFILTLLHIH